MRCGNGWAPWRGSTEMGLGDSYLNYPKRGLGMDQGRFPHRRLRDAQAMRWPDGKPVGVWITVGVEWFPLDMGVKPFAPLGAPERPYPDTQTYTARDYGHRVGIYRLMDAFARHGVKPTAAVNSAVADRYPLLLEAIGHEGWEVMAAGVDMGQLHHSGLAPEAERALVHQSLDTLRKASGQAVLGWRSPAFSESAATPELVAASGVRWIADWANDEKPYEFALADGGSLLSLPASFELSDTKIIHQHSNSLADFEHQILAAFKQIRSEATTEDGRILALSVAPWLMGQPYRIAAMERLLATIFGSGDAVSVTAEQIATAWQGPG